MTRRYDEVVRQLGEFGPYQRRIYFLLCLPGATHGIRMVLSVFLLFTPKHRCAIPGYENDTYAVQSPAHAEAIKSAVPWTADGEPDSCLLYSSATGSKTNNSNNSFTYYEEKVHVNGSTTSVLTAATTQCYRWVFDTSVMDRTAASDFQLVCGDALKTSHATMAYMFGYLVGVFALGVISDWLGRKRSLCLSVVLLASSGLGLAAANSYYLFAIINFFIGAATAAVWTSAFVIGMELVGPSKRKYTGIIIMFFFAGGLLALGGVAWGVRDWRYLDVIVTSPVLLYLSYWCLVPESPRWLLQKGRLEEAQEIINKAARVNEVTPPPDVKIANEEDDETGCRDNRNETSGSRGRWVVLEFCSSRTLLGRTFVVCYNWFVVSLVYYALSLNVGNLGVGGLHVNFLLSSVVEVPAYALCLFLLEPLGRRRLHCAVMLTAGLGCGATLLPLFLMDSEHQETTVVLAMVGKLGAAAAFASVYVYSSELFPTVLRNAGMGTASVCARVGGMIAPYIAGGGRLLGGGGVMGRAFPLMVCGPLAVSAGLLALLLPETRGQDMPDTVRDLTHPENAWREPNARTGTGTGTGTGCVPSGEADTNSRPDVEMAAMTVTSTDEHNCRFPNGDQDTRL